jgi:hypothetical protein
MPRNSKGKLPYAVDYWKTAPAEGDPDRSEYSDDLVELKKRAKKLKKKFPDSKFFERASGGAGWKAIKNTASD